MHTKVCEAHCWACSIYSTTVLLLPREKNRYYQLQLIIWLLGVDTQKHTLVTSNACIEGARCKVMALTLLSFIAFSTRQKLSTAKHIDLRKNVAHQCCISTLMKYVDRSLHNGKIWQKHFSNRTLKIKRPSDLFSPFSTHPSTTICTNSV